MIPGGLVKPIFSDCKIFKVFPPFLDPTEIRDQTVPGITWEKPEDVFKPEKKNSKETWKPTQRARTLPTIKVYI